MTFLVSMPLKTTEKEKLVSAFVAFVDIRGHGSFMRRLSDHQTEFLPFRRDWRKLIDKFEKKTGYFVKRLGDGIMIIKEVDQRIISREAVDFTNNTWMLLMDGKRLIRKKHSPRPDGILLRKSFGSIWKEPCVQFKYDYVADKLNMTEKMIHWNKGVCIVLHESYVDKLNDSLSKKFGYVIKKLERDPNLEDQGPYEPDTKLLYSLVRRKYRV